MTIGKRIKLRREELGISVDELATILGKNRATIYRYESEEIEKLPTTVIGPLAKAMQTTPAYLMGWTESSNISAVYDDHIRMIPVYASVSAGFGALADDTVIGRQPVRIVSDSEAAETLCIRVTGDSMYPKIEDGDIIQVRKQDSVDSGSIAVVLLDGEEGLVKRVVYGDTWIELHSTNPMYPVQRFEGAEVQRLRVVGLVRGVIRVWD